MGDELASRKLSITLAPGLVIHNGDEAVALFRRYLSDKAGLSAAISLPPSTSLENYFTDLVEALDDCVKPTSDITDKMISCSRPPICRSCSGWTPTSGTLRPTR